MIDAILINLPQMMSNILRFCKLLLILVLINQVTVAQNTSNNFHISGRVRVDNGDPTGTIVTLVNTATQQTEKSETVNSTGKFELDLSYFSEYMLTVVKENHYTKDIEVSTMIPSKVWEKDSIFPAFLMAVTIYKKVPFATMSFEGKTIGKITYSPKGKLDNFDALNYIDDRDIRKEIDQALKDHEDEIFNQKMAEAVEFEKKNQIREAIKTYEEALAIRKNDPFIKPKLKELSSDLKGMDQEAMLEAEFNRLVTSGDANVLIMKYPEGIANFKSALDMKPGNQVVLDKISNAEKLLAQANAEKAKLEAEFNRLLAAGDLNVTEKEYPEAIVDFNSALTLKAGDKIATAKLANAERLLANLNADKVKQEAEFKRLLAAGDQNVLNQKYPEGITNFKDALNIKPGEPVAVAKLANAEQLWASLNADKAKMEAEFKRLLAAGDDNVTNQKYPEGITNFKDALKIKAGDAVATAKLANAEQLLAKANADKAKMEADFARLLAAGDANVIAQKYPEAIDNFKGALNLKAGDKIATDKLANAEQLWASLNADKAKMEAEFKRLLAAGDDNVTNQKYPEGITNFKDALKIKAGDAVATAKLANAEQLLAKANADKAKMEADFARLLAAGDANVIAQKYPEAIDNFKGALNLKAGDKIATDKLANAEQLWASLNADKAKMEAEFKRLLAAGDDNVTNQKYPEGITNFKDALKIKAGDAVATAKLANAEQLLAKANADKTKLEADFARLLAAGDANVMGQKYPEAIENFKGALNLKSGDKIATDKLANAEGLWAKLNADKAKMEEEFNRLLAVGDDNVTNQKYPEGITNFKDALKIKAGDAVATAKMANAEQLLAKANADKTKLEADFARLLAAGDANVMGQKYPEAIENFKGALNLKSGDKIATDKLANAEGLWAKLNADKAKMEEEFNRLLASGDDNVTNQKYPEGITNFKDALKIKAGDAVATAKLANAEQLLAKANADKAKIEADFARLLAVGDANVMGQKYPEAIENFKGALNLKSGDQIATYKLANAEKLWSYLKADNAKIEAEYKRLLAAGDENVTNQKYPEGITNFKDALKIKAGDALATSKLANAEQLLAKTNADKAKLEADFARLLAAGDANVMGQKYPEAIDNFKGALNLKSGDKIATDKLANAEQLWAKLNADKAKLEEEFKRLLAAGDDNVTSQKYPEGITNFKDALKIKAGDAVATAKLANAEKLLAEILAEKLKKENELKLLAEKQKKYQENIARADQYFAAKTYPEARNQYLEAIKIIDTEKYPKDKITEIDSLLAKLAAEKLLAQKMADEQRRLQGEGSYLKNIQTGDANFAKTLWSVAIFYYQEALKFKAADKYALEKIDNCKRMIDSNITAERMQEYTSFIRNADDDMKEKRYSSARFHYGKAAEILPWENYPKTQLAEVEKLISATDLTGTDAQYVDAIKKAEEAVVQKNIAIARFYFQKAITLKPDEAYPKEQLKKLSSGL